MITNTQILTHRCTTMCTGNRIQRKRHTNAQICNYCIHTFTHAYVHNCIHALHYVHAYVHNYMHRAVLHHMRAHRASPIYLALHNITRHCITYTHAMHILHHITSRCITCMLASIHTHIHLRRQCTHRDTCTCTYTHTPAATRP